VTFITLTNAGKVTSRGAEVELSALPAPGLELAASLGLTNARYEEFKDGGGDGIDYDGHALAGAPDFQYSLRGDYRKPLGGTGNLVLHGDLSYRDDYFTNANNNRQTNLVKGYSLLNGRVGFEPASENWAVFFSMRNMTDKLYMSAKGMSFGGVHGAWFEPPRTYTVRLTYYPAKL
jgi:iron complex outermembrane receptor protein